MFVCVCVCKFIGWDVKKVLLSFGHRFSRKHLDCTVTIHGACCSGELTAYEKVCFENRLLPKFMSRVKDAVSGPATWQRLSFMNSYN